jgi:acetate kinase
MKILAVNVGSSSLKFQVYEMPEEKVIISGNFERIGIEDSFYTLKINGEKIKKECKLDNHAKTVQILVEELLNNNIVKNLEEIKAVGHRVVHGGDYFNKSVIIDDDVINKINELCTLAPLHNPGALMGIKAFCETIKGAVNVAVFDTAFHQTMPKENYLYALPLEWHDKYKVRRYGAHGTSHKYVSLVASKLLNNENAKIIVCHIGSGASISAIKDGKCVATSMGFTPNAGVIMGTRCGDIDASIIPYMMKQTGMTADEIDTAINKKSGLLGLTGYSDHRNIEEEMANNNEICLLADKMFANSVADYIARYFITLGGADAICFTAGIGEKGKEFRKEVLTKLAPLNIFIDEEKNNALFGELGLISADNSSVKCFVIPTDEELMIARDTLELVK